jgi:hypothetical protein
VALTDAELQQVLLARLAGEADARPEISMADLIGQALGDNPMAPQITAALRRRELARQAEEGERAERGDGDPVVADVLERLYAEVQTLRARNAMLADALGACPRCWGEDVRCVRCQGRGRPGGRQPDRLLFTEIIEPAVRRAAVRPASAASPVPASETRNEAGAPRGR